MEAIRLIGVYGNIQKLIEISQPNGGGESYQVLIDKYLQGTVNKLNGEWVAYLNKRSHLTSDDIMIIGDIIDNKITHK